jgi:hypothetical protein
MVVADDTAFHDRWAAHLPGWELPKLTPEVLTSHVGLHNCWGCCDGQGCGAVWDSHAGGPGSSG